MGAAVPSDVLPAASPKLGGWELIKRSPETMYRQTSSNKYSATINNSVA